MGKTPYRNNMIHLASNSQSRALLLNNFNIEFKQQAPLYDEEQIQTKTAKDFAYIASKGKLEAAVKEFGLDTPLLTADSVIVSANKETTKKAKKHRRCQKNFRTPIRFKYCHYLCHAL